MATDGRTGGGETRHWWLFGASGFVGSGITAELAARGIAHERMRAERLATGARDAAGILREAHDAEAAGGGLVRRLADAIPAGAVVVNAAGLAAPDSPDGDSLYGANALWPAVLALACARAGASRLVHLSSAAVQGERAVLDETWEASPFSPYSRSKALGEHALEALLPGLPAGLLSVVRATSVQGPGRRTTASLARVASSPLASVAGRGDAPSPVSSLAALAQFTVDVALAAPGQVLVLQPWEGMTVRSVLAAAGGREPLHLPAWMCRAAVRTGYALSGLAGGRLHGAVRRAEVMWFGQGQTPGWAEANGVVPMPRAEQVLREAAQSRKEQARREQDRRERARRLREK
ncbi:NAD-dependent epimerase/dehydratase family protein [Sinomonas halotolerans]|uniref:NAD-dependent epimerase/dehydratase family protein n=1 Tax=Sinomonas halotolerans TaxID=1644133 RepID=A0ABU9WWQ4_9MICC